MTQILDASTGPIPVQVMSGHEIHLSVLDHADQFLAPSRFEFQPVDLTSLE